MNITKIKFLIKKIISLILKKILSDTYVLKYSSKPIYIAADFCFTENIKGDYLEFGVFKGHSFIEAYHACENASKKWSSKKNNQNSFDDKEIANQSFEKITFKMDIRYFAFDSFKGLPKLKSEDTKHARFHEGRYSVNKETFLKNCSDHAVDIKKIICVEGFYENTLTDSIKKNLELSSAAIIMIDCDLYSSTKLVLNFITPLLQKGTVIIFDDWFCHKGSINEGEQKATAEWLAINKKIRLIDHGRYGHAQKSFIVNLQ